MAISIQIPSSLRVYVKGARSVDVVATTVAGALRQLANRVPAICNEIFETDGTPKPGVSVRLRDSDVLALGPNLEALALEDGDELVIVPTPAIADVRLSNEELLRYGRHLLMPEVTLEGQKRLKRAKVLCIGAGGLGSPLTLYLAAAGVGTLGVVDFDRVDLTNLQRQIIYDTADVGRDKVEAARERLAQLNPEIAIVPHAERLTSGNVLALLEGYDIVADGTDNFGARYLINDACVLLGVPNVHASVYRFEGQLSVFDAKRGPCFRCLFAEPPPPELAPSCGESGVLGVLPGILGTLQALEVMKLILGRGESLVGRLLLFDALSCRFRELSVKKDPACRVCGASPTIKEPVDGDLPCQSGGARSGSAIGATVDSISVGDFAARRSEVECQTLLDVREPHELEIAKIPGSISIPLSELPERMRELDATKPYTLHCHKSARSIRAYRLMRDAGFRQVRVLDGGIDAWAEHIDPTMPRY